MNFIAKLHALRTFSLKTNLFRRDIESAFYSKKVYKPSDFVSANRNKLQPEYLSGLHTSFKEGINAWHEAQPREAEELLQSAHSILTGRISIMHTTLSFGNPPQINWHCDVLSGVTYPQIPSWKFQPEDIEGGGEAAIPQVLGRLHSCTTLAVCSLLSPADGYAEKTIELLEDFNEQNPIGIGIQWQDNSEVAIRAINILYCIIFLYPTLEQQPDRLKYLLQMLFTHAVFLDANLGKEPFTDHKTIITLLGMFVVGTVFSATEYGKELIHKSVNLCEQEIRKQVFPDGVAYFHSIPSQVLLTEAIQLFKLHSRFASVQLSDFLKGAYHRLNETLRLYLYEDGSVPNIGDAVPSGILNFRGSPYSPDPLELLSTAFFLDAEKQSTLPSTVPTIFHYIHFHDRKLFNSIRPGKSNREDRSTGLQQGGHYILRDQNTTVFIKAAEIGKHGHGAPGHNDSFTFEMRYKGEPFIIDTGTFSFFVNKEKRNAFRSVMHHNTCYIDLTQLAEFVGTSGIKTDLTKPSVLEWFSDNSEDRLIAQHFAYIRLENPVICKRTFKFNKDKQNIKIKDEFLGGGSHIIASNLHLHPNVLVEKIGHLKYKLSSQQAQIQLQYHIANDNADVSIIASEFSPTYGVLQTNSKLHLRYHEQLPAFYIMEFELL